MANCAYLYSLTHRPAAYVDRPEAITGLSEWPYDVPFVWRLLMSGDPQLCASLISDGLENEGDGTESVKHLYAVSSAFDQGIARLERFFAIVRHGVQHPVQGGASAAGQTPVTGLLQYLDDSLNFLHAHRHPYLLLETVELDLMEAGTEADLRALVEAELTRCQLAGAALDALPDDLTEAARQLQQAASECLAAPLSAFYGLRLDDEHDNTRDDQTEYPLGLEWSDVLYYSLWNKAEFEAQS
ncbi:MAG: hypothetical protein ACK5ME_04550 [Parahaliea sp.]